MEEDRDIRTSAFAHQLEKDTEILRGVMGTPPKVKRVTKSQKPIEDVKVQESSNDTA